MKVIETLLPDGPHWFSGIQRVERNGALIVGPQWSPYWEDRKELDDTQAAIVFEAIGSKMEGAKIVHVSDAMSKDSRTFLGEKDGFTMRAKYLSKGLHVKIPGHGEIVFRVREVRNNVFIMGSLMKDGNSSTHPVTVGRNSSAIVTVVGKQKEVDA